MKAVVDKGFLIPGVINELPSINYDDWIKYYILYLKKIHNIDSEDIEEL